MGVDHIGEAGLRQEIQRLWRELRRVARATMQNSAIGRAGLRIYDGGWLRIENGGLQITGTAIVSGRLEGSGTFDWTGPMNLRGSQSVTGPTTFTGQVTVNGPWDLNGDGDISGNVDVTGDITVLGGGLIKVGNIVLDPSVNGGTIKVGAHSIYVNGAVLTIVHSNGAQVVLNNSGASLVGGGKSLSLQTTGAFLSGLPTVSRVDANNAVVGTVWVNTSGQLFRVVA